MERAETRRALELDLVRAAAAVLVLAVHFFLNTGFYSVPLQGGTMLAALALRMVCMTCVPLFMVLTGYLCSRHTWSLGYYRRLAPVLLTYLLAACVCLAFRLAVMGERFSLLGAVRRVLDFSAAPYAWYVEMYIGLFLLIPFVNAAWNALERRGRGALLLSLLFLTALPTVTNLFGQILPEWWMDLYPLTYYVLGAWLKENPVRIRRRWLAAGWLVLACAAAVLRFVMSRGAAFTWSAVSDWGSLLVMGETVCLFSLLCSCKGERCPSAVRWCIQRAARLALPMYLISYVTDQIIYPPLCAAVPSVGVRLLFFPVMVALSLLISGAMAQLLDWAVRALLRLLSATKSV